MRVVIVGATGNVGTSLIESLAGEPAVEQVTGVARRRPEIDMPKTEWVTADVLEDDLAEIFSGADCVVHLAWLIQPSHDLELMDAVNIRGTLRVLKAVEAAGVPSVVVASSVGAYSAGPKDRRVDESWPTEGIPSCYYSRQKVAVERLVDQFELDSPSTRVVRIRPAIIMKADAAAEIRRFFVGPFLPNFLVRSGMIPVVPDTKRLAFQIVHSRDVGDAYRRAIVSDARGAFNLAAEPVVDPAFLSRVLDAKPVPVHPGLLRAAASAAWRLRLQPTDPSWLDMGLGTPLLDSSRARDELGWTPARSAEDTFCEFLEALREDRGFNTPPLDREAGGRMRIREFATGVGGRQW
jgi:UDP-glucose 4-epimerase